MIRVKHVLLMILATILSVYFGWMISFFVPANKTDYSGTTMSDTVSTTASENTIVKPTAKEDAAYTGEALADDALLNLPQNAEEVLDIQYYLIENGVSTPVSEVKDAGQYKAYINIKTSQVNANWAGDDTSDALTISFTVAKKIIEVPAEDSTSYAYTGEEITYKVPQSEYYTVSGQTQTEVGDYYVTLSLTDPKNTAFEGVDGSVVTFSFTIHEYETLDLTYAVAIMALILIIELLAFDVYWSRKEKQGVITYTFGAPLLLTAVIVPVWQTVALSVLAVAIVVVGVYNANRIRAYNQAALKEQEQLSNSPKNDNTVYSVSVRPQYTPQAVPMFTEVPQEPEEEEFTKATHQEVKLLEIPAQKAEELVKVEDMSDAVNEKHQDSEFRMEFMKDLIDKYKYDDEMPKNAVPVLVTDEADDADKAEAIAPTVIALESKEAVADKADSEIDKTKKEVIEMAETKTDTEVKEKTTKTAAKKTETKEQTAKKTTAKKTASKAETEQKTKAAPKKPAVKDSAKAAPKKTTESKTETKKEPVKKTAAKATEKAQTETKKQPAPKAIKTESKEKQIKTEPKVEVKKEHTAQKAQAAKAVKAESKTQPKVVVGKKDVINLDVIDKNFKAGEVVTLAALQQKGLVAANVGYIKVLARGKATKAYTVEAQRFSQKAVRMIAEVGGTAREV